MTTRPTSLPPGARPLTALLLMLLGPLILGCLLAPPVFTWLKWLLAHGALPEWLGSDIKFERVASRCVMIVAVFLLAPAFRLAGLGGQLKADLTPRPDRWNDLGRSVMIGCGSMFALYVGGWVIGAYRLGHEAGMIATEMGAIMLYLFGAVVIGVFEESFFRGFIFGAIRHRTGPRPAVLLASLFFSSVHFFRPDVPGVVTSVTWRSGFDLLPYLFSQVHVADDWPSAVTLFLMGMTLCIYYEKQGHLYYVIGLHGGWVWAMRLGGHYFDRNRDVLESLFSRSDLIARGPIAMVIIFGFFLASLKMSPRPRR